MNSIKPTLRDVQIIKEWNSQFDFGVLRKKIIKFFENCDNLGYVIDGFRVDLSIPNSKNDFEEVDDEDLDICYESLQADMDELPLIWFFEKDDEDFPIFKPVRSSDTKLDLDYALEYYKKNIVELIVPLTNVERKVSYIWNGKMIIVSGNLRKIQDHFVDTLNDNVAIRLLIEFLKINFLDENVVHSFMLTFSDRNRPITIGITTLTKGVNMLTQNEIDGIKVKVFKNKIEQTIFSELISAINTCLQHYSSIQFNLKSNYFTITNVIGRTAFFAGATYKGKPAIRFRESNIPMRNIAEEYKLLWKKNENDESYRSEPWYYVEINSVTVPHILEIMQNEIQRNQ